ncbi:hypothetical protein CCP1ISM_140001 [Azospirillaceae bacterium]
MPDVCQFLLRDGTAEPPSASPDAQSGCAPAVPVAMAYRQRTKVEPWRCECPAYGLRSDYRNGAAFDLCRRLVALGVRDGPAIVARDGKPALIIGSIHEAAKWTVVENETEGPRFGRYKPYPEPPFPP